MALVVEGLSDGGEGIFRGIVVHLMALKLSYGEAYGILVYLMVLGVYLQRYICT